MKKGFECTNIDHESGISLYEKDSCMKEVVDGCDFCKYCKKIKEKIK